jgi:hypothetical protein
MQTPRWIPLEDDETTEMLLTDTGITPNTSTCYVSADSFKLLPHSLGRTLAGLNKTHIVLTNIDNILKPGEQELLQIHLNSPIHLREIDSAIKQAAGNKDRAELDVATVLGHYGKMNLYRLRLYIGLLE